MCVVLVLCLDWLAADTGAGVDFFFNHLSDLSWRGQTRVSARAVAIINRPTYPTPTDLGKIGLAPGNRWGANKARARRSVQ